MMDFLQNLSFNQILLLTLTITVILSVFLYVLNKILSSSSFKINMKTGEIEKRREESKEIDFKNFLKDVYLIVNKTIEINSKKEYIYLVERSRAQMNIATDHIEKKKAMMKKMFLDRLDTILKEQNKTIDNLTTHKDFITFSILLKVLYHETNNIIYETINEDSYINADISSLVFKEYINTKIDKIINNDNTILNQYYINIETLTRTDVYKLYRENESTFRNALVDMFYDTKLNNDKYVQKAEDLNTTLKEYIETYLDEGAEAALEKYRD